MTRSETYDSDATAPYEEYDSQFDPLITDRKARRHRRPGGSVGPRRSEQEIVAELADADAMEIGFRTTYQPSRFERGWLLSSLNGFYEEGLITDVLAQVKGGKEASVYRCQAHPATGMEYLAAKVYRPRMLRNLRNDKLYRQGRETLTDGGRVVRKNDQRSMKAITRKTRFGLRVRHISWLMYEFITLRTLHQAGAAVPRPLAAGANAILMEYCGDAHRAAPTLQEVDLASDEAPVLFAEAMRNVELMLSHDLIHGDLSAYNILYWEGAIALIDFPQVINVYVNRQAREILTRDVTRTCEYFSRQGVACDPAAIAGDLWSRYGVEQEMPEEMARYEDE